MNPTTPIDDVKIIEPPLQELTKRRPSLVRGCVTGCGCIVIFVIAIVIGIRLWIGPGPETSQSVPVDFPADIPVYDRDSVVKINIIPGRYKHRSVALAGTLPKLLFSPILPGADDESTGTANERSAVSKIKNAISEVAHILTTPADDARDSIQIEWGELTADINFITNYYRSELRKKGFVIVGESKTENAKQFSFSRADGLNGSFYAESLPGSPNGSAERAVLTVNLPEQL